MTPYQIHLLFIDHFSTSGSLALVTILTNTSLVMLLFTAFCTCVFETGRGAAIITPHYNNHCFPDRGFPLCHAPDRTVSKVPARFLLMWQELRSSKGNVSVHARTHSLCYILERGVREVLVFVPNRLLFFQWLGRSSWLGFPEPRRKRTTTLQFLSNDSVKSHLQARTWYSVCVEWTDRKSRAVLSEHVLTQHSCKC